MTVAEYYHESGRGGGKTLSAARILCIINKKNDLSTIEIWAVFVNSVNQRTGERCHSVR